MSTNQVVAAHAVSAAMYTAYALVTSSAVLLALGLVIYYYWDMFCYVALFLLRYLVSGCWRCHQMRMRTGAAMLAQHVGAPQRLRLRARGMRTCGMAASADVNLAHLQPTC